MNIYYLLALACIYLGVCIVCLIDLFIGDARRRKMQQARLAEVHRHDRIFHLIIQREDWLVFYWEKYKRNTNEENLEALRVILV